MHIHAGLQPPRAVLEELTQAVGSARRLIEVPPAREKRFGRRREVPQDPIPAECALEPIPIDEMQVRVAGFGNVTADDGRRVVDALAEVAADWVRPRLFFSELEDADGSSVRVKLDGDLDALTTIARTSTRCVERLGFFVDRRRFQPGIEVARFMDATGPADIAAVAEALSSFKGQEWEVDFLTLFTMVFVGERSESRMFDTIAVGGRGAS